MKRIILASQSPRRQALLQQIGLGFEVIPAHIEETINLAIAPEEMVQILASRKAEEVALELDSGIVIAADTMVVLEQTIMGKPADSQEAYQMLSALNGKQHRVITGLCVLNALTGKMECGAESTDVFFRQLSETAIRSYIQSGEGIDKAGSYAIQGLGALMVEHIQGCYFNVVGLPLSRLSMMLERQGVYLLGR